MASPSGDHVSARHRLFTGATLASRTFEVLVATAAIVAGGYVAFRLPGSPSALVVWPVIIATAAAGITAVVSGGLFTVPTGAKTHRNPASGAVFAILLTLPAGSALPIAFVGVLITQLLRRYYRRERLTWPTIVFNLAQYVVAWAMTSAAFTRIGLDLAEWPPTTRWAVAAVGAGTVYSLFNTWIVAVWNALRRRAVTWDLWVHNLGQLAIPMSIGAIAARAAVYHPLLGLGILAAAWIGYWATSRIDDTRLKEIASGFGAIVEAAERGVPGFAEHSERVSWWAERLARHLGASTHDAAMIGIAGKLHDLGKAAMGIPITEDGDNSTQAATLHFHPAVAGDALMRCRGFEAVARYVRSQAEWFDGSGYPDGRAANAIPLASRILAVADAYDTALCRHRAAGDGGTEPALEPIWRGAGTRFDPSVVRALETVVSADATVRAYAGALSREFRPAMAFAGLPSGVAVSEAPFGADHNLDDCGRGTAQPRTLPWAPLSSRDQKRSRSLLEAQEAERRSLAGELHDEIGGMLTQLSCALKAVPACASRCGVRDTYAIVQTLTERVRDFSHDLRPSILDDLGLTPTLEWYTERHTSRTKIQVHLTHAGLDRRLDPAVELAAYRIVQEGLTNAAKHAQASEIFVHTEERCGVLTISIRDNGTGFEPEIIHRFGRTSGFAGIRARAASVGGALRITSRPGSGTSIEASLPTHVSGSWKH